MADQRDQRARTAGAAPSGPDAGDTGDTTTGPTPSPIPVTGTGSAPVAPRAEQTPGEQQQAAAAAADRPVSATAAGEDGRPRVLFIAGMQDLFGPIELTDDDHQPITDEKGDPVVYWLDRSGTEIAGEHVAKVRAIAAASHVPLRSELPSRPEQAATTS